MCTCTCACVLLASRRPLCISPRTSFKFHPKPLISLRASFEFHRKPSNFTTSVPFIIDHGATKKSSSLGTGSEVVTCTSSGSRPVISRPQVPRSTRRNNKPLPHSRSVHIKNTTTICIPEMDGDMHGAAGRLTCGM